jgi:hypothetical protein
MVCGHPGGQDLQALPPANSSANGKRISRL